MVKLSSWLHLPKIHRNGKVQETQVPGEVYPPEDIQPIEAEEPIEEGKSPHDAHNDLKELQKLMDDDDPRFDIQEVPHRFQLREVEEIEELVRDYAGIEVVRVSFKTSSNDGTRHLQIRVRSSSKMRSRQYQKFKERVIRDVAPRIPPEITIEVSKLKRTPQSDSNDPSS